MIPIASAGAQPLGLPRGATALSIYIAFGAGSGLRLIFSVAPCASTPLASFSPSLVVATWGQLSSGGIIFSVGLVFFL